MSKLVLSTVGQVTSSQSILNDNFDDIEGAIENTLSRDGSSPNEMNSDLDMNSQRVYNLPEPSSSSEPLRYVDFPVDLSISPVEGDTVVYSSDSETFNFQPSSVGPAGPTGPAGSAGDDGDDGTNGTNGTNGINGADGDDGALWYTGSGAPSGALGIVGDFYLNSANGDYYEKTGASTWTASGNLKGADGAGAGDVVGPASVTDDLPAIFDGTTGKLLKQKTYAAFKTLLSLVKGDVGLGSVDNTADIDKPVSTAQSTINNLKANLISPTLTGTPLAPTAAPGTNTTQLATTGFVKAAVDVVLGGVAGAFDTLSEIVAGFIPTSLLTTRGDIIYRDATVPARLAVGAQYTVLQAGSVDPQYGAVALAQAAAVTGILSSANGGTGASLVDPNADRILFWDDSGGAVTWLTVTAPLAITTTSISVDIGLQTIFIPAAAMTSRTTNGAAAGSIEKTTNKNMFVTKDFDTTTQEFVQFSFMFPESWNEGTVTFAPVWSHPSTTTNFGVAFGLAGVAISNDDVGDVAFGTAVTSVDTGGTTDDIYVGPTSAAITIAGTPAAGDWTMFQLNRTVADGGDTMAVDARLHGVKLLFTINALKDAS